MFSESQKITVQEFAKAMKLEVVYGEPEWLLEISTVNVNRPGLQFAGFFDYFANNRIQLLGNAELHYLNTLSRVNRLQVLDTFFGYRLPCIIMSRGHNPHEDLLAMAMKYHCPIFKSQLVTTAFMNELVMYLNELLAPTVNKHAGLMDVYGVGILIVGKSGIGKSETSLELVKRGHRLIADDSVIIKRVNDKLVGSSPEMIRYFMEVRGIGIIDIRSMYGVGSVGVEMDIEMVIELEQWDDNKAYDRLGDKQETCEILDVTLPKLLIPVRPGRNLAIIMEVAARNHRLKSLGYNAANEIIRRSMT